MRSAQRIMHMGLPSSFQQRRCGRQCNCCCGRGHTEAKDLIQQEQDGTSVAHRRCSDSGILIPATSKAHGDGIGDPPSLYLSRRRLVVVALSSYFRRTGVPVSCHETEVSQNIALLSENKDLVNHRRSSCCQASPEYVLASLLGIVNASFSHEQTHRVLKSNYG